MKVTISLILLISLISCAYVAKPTSNTISQIKEVRLKNYTVGNKATSYVGEPIVRVKNYSVMEIESSMKATNDFNIKGGLLDVAVNVNGRRGQKFPIVGTVNVNGVDCKAIQIPGTHLVFGILPDGKFSERAAAFNYMYSPLKGVNVYTINPDHTRFLVAKEQHVLEDFPYENIEIIYSGKSEDAIHFLYREYTTTDLIRPAFSQELSFPPDSKSIRYKSYKITLYEVTPEKIVYTVVSEG